ncbi:MAG: hypothetical protein PHT07_14415 [Paludibacter sp.]|nr:hypothetical protein [Paludibacter sp.]
MTTTEFENSIIRNRVFFKRSKLVEYWINFLFISFVMTMILIVDIESDIESNNLPKSLFFLTLLILLLLWHKIKARKFEVWQIKVSEKQFKATCLATSIYLDWRPENITKNYFKANKSSGFQWDSIEITAIRTENEILFNSMPAPSIRSNPFSFGLNKKNRNLFRTQLQKALNGENVVELAEIDQKEKDDKFWKESELSPKNLVLKILGYSLTLFFVGLSVFILYTNFSITSIIFCGAILNICSIFIIADFKIIKEKNRRKKPST